MKSLVFRPPVVSIVGHVDHGKTTLLDAIKDSNVVINEFGGITQRINVYQVVTSYGGKITLLDTPGHVVFDRMRFVSIKVTDLVVLVIAADEGIKEQTLEAISYIKLFSIPFIVAITKVDKIITNLDNIYTELLFNNVSLERFGGDVVSVEVSGKFNINIDKLESSILAVSEFLDFKADLALPAVGIIIDSKLDSKRGISAVLIVKSGVLRVGSFLLVEKRSVCRIRLLLDEDGVSLNFVFPSQPVEVYGFNLQPLPGCSFVVVDSSYRSLFLNSSSSKLTNESFSVGAKKIAKDSLFLIIKCDFYSSVSTILDYFGKFKGKSVLVDIIKISVGDVAESDVILADDFNAIILYFNVNVAFNIFRIINERKIRVYGFNLIYDFFNKVCELVNEKVLSVRNVVGVSIVKRSFFIDGNKIAGCLVLSGFMKSKFKIVVIRNKLVALDSYVKNLRRLNCDVDSVGSGLECGVIVDNYYNIVNSDILECFEV